MKKILYLIIFMSSFGQKIAKAEIYTIPDCNKRCYKKYKVNRSIGSLNYCLKRCSYIKSACPSLEHASNSTNGRSCNCYNCPGYKRCKTMGEVRKYCMSNG